MFGLCYSHLQGPHFIFNLARSKFFTKNPTTNATIMLALQVVFNIAVFKNDRKEEDTKNKPPAEEKTEDDVRNSSRMSHFAFLLLIVVVFLVFLGNVGTRIA